MRNERCTDQNHSKGITAMENIYIPFFSMTCTNRTISNRRELTTLIFLVKHCVIIMGCHFNLLLVEFVSTSDFHKLCYILQNVLFLVFI